MKKQYLRWYRQQCLLVLGTFTCKAEDTFAAGDVGVTETEANNSDFDSISSDKMTVKPVKVSAAGLKKIEKKDSTCKVKGNNEYYICECGQADCDRIYKNDKTTKTTVEAETLPLAEHKFTSETVDAKYLASAATCAAPAKYFKSCTVCGEKGTDTFESGAKDPDKH